MRYKAPLLNIILLLFSLTVTAQYYDTGQDPASLKWLQINTKRFKVIYPEQYGKEGVEFARSLDRAYSDLSLLFQEKEFRIPVVIHSFTVQSNGYVAWAPKRMELYPTPEQNTIPVNTQRELSLHESTHVLQMVSLNKGFSKVMGYVFGQQFPGAVASLLPSWYLEGHAVFAESALSRSGRGRAPDFQKELKAMLLEKGKIYNYDKMVSGSFRDYTPDQYRYGFQMVTWSLAKYDLHLWNKVLGFTADEPFTINPVNISLRSNTGLTKKRLFVQTFDSLKTIWEKDLAGSKAHKYIAVSPSKKGNYVGYHSPVFAGKDSIIAIKTSLKEPPSFVLIHPSSGSEKKLHVPGLLYPYFLSYGKGKIVWVENQLDPRWENRTYSVIRIKYLDSGRTLQLTHGSRYMSASVSPDGNVIAASENSAANVNTLAFIDPSSGNVLQKYQSPGNASLQYPRWSDDGSKIIFIYLDDAGEGIMAFDYTNKSWQVMLEAEKTDLQSAFLRNDSLFFVTSASGTENIMLHTPSGLFHVTNSRFGATDVSLGGSQVLFCDYTSSGNDICITPIEDVTKAGGYVSQSSLIINRFNLIEKEKKELPGESFTPEPYKKWQHLFSVHSWMPVYADIEAIQSDPASIRPGFTIMSQNTLSTLIASAGYEYSTAGENLLHAKIIWKGWYPVIESKIDYGYRPVVNSAGAPENLVPTAPDRGYRIINAIYIPFRFTTGRFSQLFYPSFSTDFRNNYEYLRNTGDYDHGQIKMAERIYFSNYYRQASRDIYPQWAQVFDLTYTFAPFDKLIYGTGISLKTSFYFPGFFPNNSVRIRFEREKQKFSEYLTMNSISFPRSYKNIISGNLSFYSVGYNLPLLYPDFNLSSFLYLKRIRGGFFYDYARGDHNYYLTVAEGQTTIDHESDGPESFRSFGASLMSDFYLFRIPYMISGGLEAAWKDIGSIPSVEFRINMNIYGFNIGKTAP